MIKYLKIKKERMKKMKKALKLGNISAKKTGAYLIAAFMVGTTLAPPVKNIFGENDNSLKARAVIQKSEIEINGVSYIVFIDGNYMWAAVKDLGNYVDETLVIPEEIDVQGRKVVVRDIGIEDIRYEEEASIRENHFIKKIIIPRTVVYMHRGPIGKCDQLREIEFANGSQLREISRDTFLYDCKIDSIEIPASVERIKEGGGIQNIRYVSFAEGSRLTQIEGTDFCFSGRLEEIELPPSVTRIGDEAFKGTNLRKITGLENVTNIGRSAFEDCSFLSSVSFGNNLKRIEDRAFAGVPLGEVYIHGYNTHDLQIEYGAFEDFVRINKDNRKKPIVQENDMLFELDIPNRSAALVGVLSTYPNFRVPEVVEVDYQKIQDENGAEEIDLTEDEKIEFKVTEIKRCNNNGSLKQITIPNTIRTIASRAFKCTRNSYLSPQTFIFEPDSSLQNLGQGAFGTQIRNLIGFPENFAVPRYSIDKSQLISPVHTNVSMDTNSIEEYNIFKKLSSAFTSFCFGETQGIDITECIEVISSSLDITNEERNSKDFQKALFSFAYFLNSDIAESGKIIYELSDDKTQALEAVMEKLPCYERQKFVKNLIKTEGFDRDNIGLLLKLERKLNPNPDYRDNVYDYRNSSQRRPFEEDELLFLIATFFGLNFTDAITEIQKIIPEFNVQEQMKIKFSKFLNHEAARAFCDEVYSRNDEDLLSTLREINGYLDDTKLSTFQHTSEILMEIAIRLQPASRGTFAKPYGYNLGSMVYQVQKEALNAQKGSFSPEEYANKVREIWKKIMSSISHIARFRRGEISDISFLKEIIRVENSWLEQKELWDFAKNMLAFVGGKKSAEGVRFLREIKEEYDLPFQVPEVFEAQLEDKKDLIPVLKEVRTEEGKEIFKDEESCITYILDHKTKTAKVSGYTANYGSRIVIPRKISAQEKRFLFGRKAAAEYRVIGIENFAFQGKDYLKEVFIPNSITEIGEGAFINCNNLCKVVFEKNSTLQKLSKSIFQNSGLREVRLPKSLEVISESAFAGCRNLEKIELEFLTNLNTIEDGAFKYSGLKFAKFPDSLTTIKAIAFAGCADLKYVSFTENSALTEIREGAFQGSGLLDISIPKTVTIIGESAFDDCVSLKFIKYDGDINEINAHKITNDECVSLLSPDLTNSSDLFKAYNQVLSLIETEGNFEMLINRITSEYEISKQDAVNLVFSVAVISTTKNDGDLSDIMLECASISDSPTETLFCFIEKIAKMPNIDLSKTIKNFGNSDKFSKLLGLDEDSTKTFEDFICRMSDIKSINLGEMIEAARISALGNQDVLLIRPLTYFRELESSLTEVPYFEVVLKYTGDRKEAAKEFYDLVLKTNNDPEAIVQHLSAHLSEEEIAQTIFDKYYEQDETEAVTETYEFLLDSGKELEKTFKLIIDVAEKAGFDRRCVIHALFIQNEERPYDSVSALTFCEMIERTFADNKQVCDELKDFFMEEFGEKPEEEGQEKKTTPSKAEIIRTMFNEGVEYIEELAAIDGTAVSNAVKKLVDDVVEAGLNTVTRNGAIELIYRKMQDKGLVKKAKEFLEILENSEESADVIQSFAERHSTELAESEESQE